jgi:hypothetical protein
MTNFNSKVPFCDILQDALMWTGLSPAQFSTQSGFSHPDRIYRALKPDGVKLGLDSLEAIVNRFPELNGDRFIRRSGPLLLKELCAEMTVETTPAVASQPAVSVSNESVDYYKGVIEVKDKHIESLEKQIEFLQSLLKK